MAEKTFLISGATDGIVRVTAMELARAGGHVILLGRERARAERVVEQIKARKRKPRGRIRIGRFIIAERYPCPGRSSQQQIGVSRCSREQRRC